MKRRITKINWQKNFYRIVILEKPFLKEETEHIYRVYENPRLIIEDKGDEMFTVNSVRLRRLLLKETAQYNKWR